LQGAKPAGFRAELLAEQRRAALQAGSLTINSCKMRVRFAASPFALAMRARTEYKFAA
jgi:hypothetical protein